MELKQIESFVRVAELGSFTKAAAALGMPQPLLSRHVRQLEVELHQNLLIRNGRGVNLTEAGTVMLEHGRGILHQVALAQEELGSVRGALAGKVSIGLPPSLSKLVTVPLTLAFRKALPQAQLSLGEGFSVVMVESLRAGRLDMAVLYNPPPSPELVFLGSVTVRVPVNLPATIRLPVFNQSASEIVITEGNLMLPTDPKVFDKGAYVPGVNGVHGVTETSLNGLNVAIDVYVGSGTYVFTIWQ